MNRLVKSISIPKQKSSSKDSKKKKKDKSSFSIFQNVTVPDFLLTKIIGGDEHFNKASQKIRLKILNKKVDTFSGSKKSKKDIVSCSQVLNTAPNLETKSRKSVRLSEILKVLTPQAKKSKKTKLDSESSEDFMTLKSKYRNSSHSPNQKSKKSSTTERKKPFPKHSQSKSASNTKKNGSKHQLKRLSKRVSVGKPLFTEDNVICKAKKHSNSSSSKDSHFLAKNFSKLSNMKCKSKKPKSISNTHSANFNFDTKHKKAKSKAFSYSKLAEAFLGRDISHKKYLKTSFFENVNPQESANFLPSYYVDDLKKCLSSGQADIDDETKNLFISHFVQTFHAVKFSEQLEEVDPGLILSKTVFIPKNSSKTKTLIFDLDETLVHCVENIETERFDTLIHVKFPSGEEAGINFRPHVFEVLRELSKDFELILFTASHECYAQKVIDLLDPQRELFSYCCFREHCLLAENGIHIKDLRIFANRYLENIIIVDNSTYSFANQLSNGIPIVPFFDDKDDSELPKLQKFLNFLLENNIRKSIRRYFKFEKLLKCKDIQEASEVYIKKS